MEKIKLSLISALSFGVFSIATLNQHVSADSISDNEKNQISNLDLNQTSVKLQDNSNQIQDKQKAIQDLQNKIKQSQELLNSSQKDVNKQINSTVNSKKDNDLAKLVISQNGKNSDSIKKIESLKLLKVTDKQKLDNNQNNLSNLNNQEKDLQKQLDDLNNLHKNIQDHYDQLNHESEEKAKAASVVNESHQINNNNDNNSNVTNIKAESTNTPSSGSVDPSKFGMDFGSIKGWSGHWYSGTPYASQCTEFVSSLMNAVYGLDVKNSNGIGMASAYASLEGGNVSDQATAGSVVSMQSSSPDGHVAFVEKVNNDGSVLIVESNTPWSGNLSGKLYTWNYRTISASTLKSLHAQYYHPKANMRNV